MLAIGLHTKTLHTQWQEWIALLLRPEFPVRDNKVLKTTTITTNSPVSSPTPPPPSCDPKAMKNVPTPHPPIKPEVGQNTALHASPKQWIQSYWKVFPLKAEVGQNIALHASPKIRIQSYQKVPLLKPEMGGSEYSQACFAEIWTQSGVVLTCFTLSFPLDYFHGCISLIKLEGSSVQPTVQGNSLFSVMGRETCQFNRPTFILELPALVRRLDVWHTYHTEYRVARALCKARHKLSCCALSLTRPCPT